LIPISWESANLTGNVAIALSTNCGASFNTIVTDTENDGEQLVNIQQSLNPVLIRVQSLSYPGVSDVSNASFCTHGPQFVCTPAPCP
jgi:predicted nuclease with TOPRIM domain